MTFRPPALLAGTAAHYEDAALYDHVYKRRTSDVAFYVEECARRGGPVLELGCGTGRVAIALARAGIEVTGVDRMASMLARGKQRLSKEPRTVQRRVRWLRGDMRKVRVKQRFPTVISPFNVWMHLYTIADVEQALATVRAHLAPGGRFIFDVLLPDPAALARDPSKFFSCGIRKIPGEKAKFRYREAFDYDPASQVQMVTMAFEEIDGDRDFITPLAHRQFFPAELEALLHYNGFSIEDRFGGFDRAPMQAGSESQILIARSASTSRRRSPPR